MSLEPPTSSTLNTTSVPFFIKKTYTILQTKKFSDIISWNPEGSSLVISKPKEFCQKVLPAYFKHNNLTSFVRQLHLYGFERQKDANCDHVYSHILFQRDKEHLLAGIQRKKQNNVILALQRTMQSKNQTRKENDTSFCYENKILKKFHSDTLTRISHLESTVLDLTIQSQALWNFIGQQKERETGLKTVLTQLINEYDFPVQELPSLLKEELNAFSVPIGNKIPSGIPLLEDSRSNKECSNCTDIRSLLKSGEESGISTGGCSYSSPKASHAQENEEEGKSKEFKPDDNLALMSNLFSKFNKDIKDKQKDNEKIPSLKNKGQKSTLALRPHDNWSLETQYLKNLSLADKKCKESDITEPKSSALLGKRSFEDLECLDSQLKGGYSEVRELGKG